MNLQWCLDGKMAVYIHIHICTYAHTYVRTHTNTYRHTWMLYRFYAKFKWKEWTKLWKTCLLMVNVLQCRSNWHHIYLYINIIYDWLTRSNLCTSLEAKFTMCPDDSFPIVVWLSLNTCTCIHQDTIIYHLM